MMNPFTPIIVLIAMGCLVGCNGSDKPAEAPADSPPSTQSQRILGLEEGWELADKAGYTAVQKDGQVVITAKGEAPSAGYEVKLVMSPLRIYPPQWMLAWKKPDGMAAQVITPFEVTASFKAADPVKSVRISDAVGAHEVAVGR